MDPYLWLKAIHVISIIAWMAAMLYLPRLLVYHAETGPGTPQSETFKVMERRLLRFIATPSLIVVGVTRRWANDANKRPARFYRFVNEVPTVLMIGIVILVVVKPF